MRALDVLLIGFGVALAIVAWTILAPTPSDGEPTVAATVTAPTVASPTTAVTPEPQVEAIPAGSPGLPDAVSRVLNRSGAEVMSRAALLNQLPPGVVEVLVGTGATLHLPEPELPELDGVALR